MREDKIKRDKLGRFIKDHKAIGKYFQKGNRITGKFYRFYPFLRSENKSWKLSKTEKEKIKKLAELIPATIIAELFKINRSTVLYWTNPKIRKYYLNYAKKKLLR